MRNPLALIFLCVGSVATAAERHNVLFIVSDDLKASVLGCYGDAMCKTPNIDRLAKRGIVFDRAYCQGLMCRPSRQSFMFSQYPWRSAKKRADVAKTPSMAEHFKNHGWYTARVGKIYHMRVPGDIIAGTNGLDHAASWTERFNCAGKEAHTPGAYALLNRNVFTTKLENRQSTGDPHRMFVTVKSDTDGTEQPDYKAADKAIELLRAHQKKPFFLAVGFVRPHYPMVAPPKYFDPYPIEKIELPKKVPGDLDDIPRAGRSRRTSSTYGIDKYPDNQKRMWEGYYATVTLMDEQVGRVLAELDRLGLRESTVVVFTSDHGYHLGEHDLWQKSDLHEEVARVPLIISVPGKKPTRVESFAELVDVYPTVAQLAGLPVPKNIDGRSLLPAIDDPKAIVRDVAYSGDGGKRAARTKDWAYMTYGARAEELYNMRNDPGQFTNLAKNEKYADVLKGFREQLAKRK